MECDVKAALEYVPRATVTLKQAVAAAAADVNEDLNDDSDHRVVYAASVALFVDAAAAVAVIVAVAVAAAAALDAAVVADI